MEQTNLDVSKKNRNIIWFQFAVMPLLLLGAVFYSAPPQSVLDNSTMFRAVIVAFEIVVFSIALFLRRRTSAIQGPERWRNYIFSWLANEVIALLAVAGSLISSDLYFFTPFFLLSFLMTVTMPPRFG